MGVRSAQLGWLTAVIFVGMMVGSYLWGSIGDLIGRRAVMIISLFVNGVFGLISSFMPSYWWFFFCRFMSGVGVGGSIPVIWSYFSELQPSYIRGRMLSLIATFWMFGQLLTAGLAWILIPRPELSFYIFSLHFQSWRSFIALSTFTCLTASFLVILLPQSPKFLLEKGNHDKALDTLASIYQQCTGKPRSEFPVKRLEASDEDTVEVDSSSGTLSKLLSQTGQLFHRPLLWTTAAMLIINFCMSFSSYGLTLWLPELFTRTREVDHHGSVCNSHSSSGFNSTLTTTLSINSTLAPTPSVCGAQDPAVFKDTFIVGLSALPGNLFTIALLDRIGRKPIFFVGAAVSAISAFFVWFVSTSMEVLIVSCVFSAVSVLCWNVLDAFGTELFPTHLRSTALGACLATARVGAILGNLAFGALIDIHCAVPILLVAAMLAVAALTSLKLKETAGRALD